MARRRRSLQTELVHAGEPTPRIEGAVGMPIFQSATFESHGAGDYHDIRYIRLNNTPNHRVLHEKLASLEGGQAALVTASGMAAITTSLLSVLRAGDHLLAQACLYGGTHNFVTDDLERMGISYDFIDGDDPASWAEKLRPNTRAVYVEAMTNPLLEVAELDAVAIFAREQGLVSMIDNTFATPVNFRPIEHGFHLCLHSATKYLNGHSDIVAGAIIGRTDLVEAVKHRLDHLGGALDPHACFLLHRGLKTLALRVHQQNESALALARMLEKHPAVIRVHYPGLESHPAHRRARSLFGGFGGVLSFRVAGGVGAARRLLASVHIPRIAPSLGGAETLITLPAETSHLGLAPAERRALGITDDLVRLAVGIEGTADLVADLREALDGLRA
jgi:cystathionine beta-lyase/cystathionine gamma-synthase